MKIIRLHRLTPVFCCLLTISLLAVSAHAQKAMDRLKQSAVVFHEIMDTPDSGIPGLLLKHSQCIMIVPGMKHAGFVFGGNFGRGVVSCRVAKGWSAPLFLTVGGGSFGLQIGAQETDLVMLIMNRNGENYLLKDKFSLGGDMAATAGPVGRSASAETDALMHAKMLAYSRSRGLFGGITLKGGVIKQDRDSNQWMYHNASAKQILGGEVHPPVSAIPLLGELVRRAGE